MTFESQFGTFLLSGYEFSSGTAHVALVSGSLDDPTPQVRIQSSCTTGTALAALGCDCNAQLRESLRRVGVEGGVIVYLEQEGAGFGLVGKIKQMNDRARLEAMRAVGSGLDDPRDYGEAAYVLRDVLGSRPIRLLTNNPQKILGLEAAGIEVAERLPLEMDPTDATREYLRFKKRVLGHLLQKV